MAKARQFLTTVAPPALPSDPEGTYTGEIYYNTTIGALKLFNGSTWSALAFASGGGVSHSIEVLSEAPSVPEVGRIYFNSEDYTIKFYNGHIWYDVAGPKELLDHTHGMDGHVGYANYGGYVSDFTFSMDGGTATTNYSEKPDDDIIDGGNA